MARKAKDPTKQIPMEPIIPEVPATPHVNDEVYERLRKEEPEVQATTLEPDNVVLFTEKKKELAYEPLPEEAEAFKKLVGSVFGAAMKQVVNVNVTMYTAVFLLQLYKRLGLNKEAVLNFWEESTKSLGALNDNNELIFGYIAELKNLTDIDLLPLLAGAANEQTK